MLPYPGEHKENPTFHVVTIARQQVPTTVNNLNFVMCKCANSQINQKLNHSGILTLTQRIQPRSFIYDIRQILSHLATSICPPQQITPIKITSTCLIYNAYTQNSFPTSLMCFSWWYIGTLNLTSCLLEHLARPLAPFMRGV